LVHRAAHRSLKEEADLKDVDAQFQIARRQLAASNTQLKKQD